MALGEVLVLKIRKAVVAGWVLAGLAGMHLYCVFIVKIDQQFLFTKWFFVAFAALAGVITGKFLVDYNTENGR